MSKSKSGIAEIILILILAVAALGVVAYFLLGDKVADILPTRKVSEIRELPLSTSDEVSAIEKDLDSTDFTSLDSELSSLEKELDASLD